MRFLKNITVAILLGLVLVQTFATMAVIVQFKSNQSYYENVLCVNKNRPELACHGKCVLMQRLSNQFEQEQRTTNQTLKKIFDNEVLLFCHGLLPLAIHKSVIVSSKDNALAALLKTFFPQSDVSDIFHPPSFSL